MLIVIQSERTIHINLNSGENLRTETILHFHDNIGEKSRPKNKIGLGLQKDDC